MPAAAAGGHGSVFFIGFAHHPASRSAGLPSTKKPFAGSKSTIRISNSTGRKFSRRSLPLPRPPLRRRRESKTERIATAAANASAHALRRASVQHHLLPPNRQNRNRWTGRN